MLPDASIGTNVAGIAAYEHGRKIVSVGGPFLDISKETAASSLESTGMQSAVIASIAEDLQKLGLKPGERFQVEANGVVLELLWGTVYGDVPKGEGIAFLTGEGVLRIARNHANVAALLGVREGDKVTIRR